MLFTGRKWSLGGVSLDSAGIGRWLSPDECKAAMAMLVGSCTVFFGRGKLVRVM